MTKKITKSKRKYLIALIQNRICPKCSRPIYVAPGFKCAKQCWRCSLRARGVTSKRHRELIKEAKIRTY
jgi:hypothetical protein